jgi:zinc protease
VIVAQDAKGLREQLVGDVFSPLAYDAPKPQEILEEDKIIGALKLGIKPENVRITPVDEVFAREAALDLSAQKLPQASGPN